MDWLERLSPVAESPRTMLFSRLLTGLAYFGKALPAMGGNLVLAYPGWIVFLLA